MDIINFLNQVKSIGLLNFLIVLIMLMLAFKTGYDFCIWIRDTFLKGYHKKEDAKENEQETIEEHENRLKSVEKDIVEIKGHMNDIVELKDSLRNVVLQMNQISDAIKGVNQSILEEKEDRRKVTVAQIRSTLSKLYEDGKAKNGIVTEREMETFTELADIYLDKGGNSAFKNFYIPEYNKFTVKDSN